MLVCVFVRERECVCVSILPIMCLCDFTQKPGLPKSPLVSNVHHPTAAVVQSLCVGVRMPVAAATVCGVVIAQMKKEKK